MTDQALEPRPGARILDRRYQRYQGPRKGAAHAARRLGVHSFQRLLGIRRSARYKIVPALLALSCFLLPIAFIAIAAFLPAGQLIGQLEYGFLFSLIGIPILLFVVLTGPGNLIADRTSKSLSLYLASPLTRTTYLAAHAGAIVTVLSLVTIGPALFYLIASVLQGAGPEDVVGFASLLGKIVLAGGFLAVYFTALTMVAGAFTDRPGIAAGAIFLGLQIVDSMGLFLSERFDNDFLRLIGIGDLPNQLVNRIFDFTQFDQFAFDLATPFLVAGAVFWIAVGMGATWWRYDRMVVSR